MLPRATARAKQVAEGIKAAVGSRMTGGIYRVGREHFIDLDRAGGAIRTLSTRKIKITPRGVGYVERHWSRFGKWGHNDVMIKRLRDI